MNNEHPIYSQHTEGSNLIVILCKDKEIQNYFGSDQPNGKRGAKKFRKKNSFIHYTYLSTNPNIKRNHGGMAITNNKSKAKNLKYDNKIWLIKQIILKHAGWWVSIKIKYHKVLTRKIIYLLEYYQHITI